MSNHIYKIGLLITEDPDITGSNYGYDKCPGCGSPYAMVAGGNVGCPRPYCQYYDKDYALAVSGLDERASYEALVSPNYPAIMARNDARHHYEGKSGVAIMRRGKDREFPQEMTEKEYNSTSAIIEFDDYIDKDHYVVLFAKTRHKPFWTKKDWAYAGKYMDLLWHWPAPGGGTAGYPGAYGAALMTRTHDALTCAKGNIKKMVVEGKIIINEPKAPNIDADFFLPPEDEEDDEPDELDNELYIEYYKDNEVIDGAGDVVVKLSRPACNFDSWQDLLDEVEQQTGVKYAYEEGDGDAVLTPI